VGKGMEVRRKGKGETKFCMTPFYMQGPRIIFVYMTDENKEHSPYRQQFFFSHFLSVCRESFVEMPAKIQKQIFLEVVEEFLQHPRVRT